MCASELVEDYLVVWSLCAVWLGVAVPRNGNPNQSAPVAIEVWRRSPPMSTPTLPTTG